MHGPTITSFSVSAQEEQEFHGEHGEKAGGRPYGVTMIKDA